MLRSNESLTWSNNYLWIWNIVVDKIGEMQQSIEDIPRNNSLKIQVITSCAIQFLSLLVMKAYTLQLKQKSTGILQNFRIAASL